MIRISSGMCSIRIRMFTSPYSAMNSFICTSIGVSSG